MYAKYGKPEEGKIYGRLTVTFEHPDRGYNRSIRWVCICECGAFPIVRGEHLRTGESKSCGCYSRDRHVEVNKARTIHGMMKSPEYRSWANMITRCTNKNNPAYKNYGGRGIKVCDRWLTFKNFYEDMGKKPDRTYTIERIDNESGYEPKNVRWATRTEQNNNTRKNIFYTYNGMKKTLPDWSRYTGVNRSLLENRVYRHHWDIKRALEQPSRKHDKNTHL